MEPVVVRAEACEVLRRAGAGFLEVWRSELGELPVVHVSGAPEAMGRQYGALVGDRIRWNADRLVSLFTGAGLPAPVVHLFLDRAWERLAAHTPQSYLDEMAAVAAGAQEAGFEVSVADMQRITAVTNLDLYKREERFLEIIGPEALEQLDEETRQALIALSDGPCLSCTMFAVWGSRTGSGKCFAVRNLDWVSQTGMHADRLVTVARPSNGHPFVSMGYAGVIGCLAGMNARGISVSEVGAFSVKEELDGIPWTLMARQVLEDAGSLREAVEIIQEAKHTLGYNYLVADGDPKRYGTPQFSPKAAAFETNYAVCEVFYADDFKEHAASWTDTSGNEQSYGTPMREAVMRADIAFGKESRGLQAADDGPGDPVNTGNPWGRNNEGSTYTTCHLPIRDMIRAYEKGTEYVFPVRGTQVIAAGAPRKMGPKEVLTIAATVAHGEEGLAENDWNVMSVVYAPTDLNFWVAYESCDADGVWKNAPGSGYWQFNLKALLARGDD